jgi:hypothetical protein
MKSDGRVFLGGRNGVLGLIRRRAAPVRRTALSVPALETAKPIRRAAYISFSVIVDFLNVFYAYHLALE